MPIYCDNCGHQNRDSATFCQGCGGNIVATTSDGNIKAGVLLNKNYEIKSLIKKGGMGAVYLAKDHRFDTDCAVKEMLVNSAKPENQQYMIESFKREAKILRNLRHPNIPVVLDYFVEASRYYLVMDYIDGKDLDTILMGNGHTPISERMVVKWTCEILDAFIYLHSQKPPLIYRDLKPANVMLKKDGKIILIDFGIARTIVPESNTTKTGIGTPIFAPKELLMGKPEIRSDIYCVGATMNCLLTGVFPVIPCDFKPVREHNPDVSQELDAIVMKALSMNIEDRYSSAREMKSALENIGYLIDAIPSSIARDNSVNYDTSFDLTTPTIKSSHDAVEAPLNPTNPTLVAPLTEVAPITSSMVKAVKKPSKLDTYLEAKYGQSNIKKPSKSRTTTIVISSIILLGLLLVGGIIVKRYMDNPDYYIELGKKYSMDNPDRAIDAFKKAMSVAKEKNDDKLLCKCYKEYGKFLTYEKKYEEAIKNLEKARELDKNDKELNSALSACYIEKGKMLYNNKDYVKAEEYFNSIIDLKLGNNVEQEANDYIKKMAGKIYFERNGDIWTIDPDGSNENRISDFGSFIFPKLSPDGKKLVYISQVDQTGGEYGDLYFGKVGIANSDGSNINSFSNRKYSNAQMVEWLSNSKSFRLNDIILDLEGNIIKKLPETFGMYQIIKGKLSPDNNNFSYIKKNSLINNRTECEISVYVSSINENNPRELISYNGYGPAIDESDCSEMINWSPDNNYITLSEWYSYELNKERKLDSKRLWVINLKENTKKVFEFAYDFYNAYWTPDSRKILVPINEKLKTNFILMTYDGKERKQILSVENYSRFICWSPDGTYFIYSQENNLWIGNIKTTKSTLLVNNAYALGWII